MKRYNVRIGEPFDQKRCDLFYDHLYIKLVSVRQFKCIQSGFGQTISTFLATRKSITPTMLFANLELILTFSLQPTCLAV